MNAEIEIAVTAGVMKSVGRVVGKGRVVADLGVGRNVHRSEQTQSRARLNDNLVSRNVTDADDVLERFYVKDRLLYLAECHFFPFPSESAKRPVKLNAGSFMHEVCQLNPCLQEQIS